MSRYRMTLLNAYQFCRKKRPVICPNVGFFKELIELEKILLGRQSVTIIKPVASNSLEVPDVVWKGICEEVHHKNELKL